MIIRKGQMKYNDVMGRFAYIIPIVAVLFIWSATSVYGADDTIIVADVSIFAQPASPSPGESFTVRADSPISDTNSSYFRWYVNGLARPELSGYGKNEIALVAGALGSKTTVRADITPQNQATSGGVVVVPVSDLSLTWSADTYTPKWYKGKALATPKSTVRVAAVPEIFIAGQLVPVEKLVFEWFINSGRVLSGSGEDVLEFETDDYSATTHPVQVRVRDFQNIIFKSASVSITTTKPRLVLYPFSPLGGIEPRAHAAATPIEKAGEVDLALEPFFFTPQSKRNLSYTWTVGGISMAGRAENPFLLSLDASHYSSDNISISVAVEQIEKIHKYITQKFSLGFK